MVLNNQRDMFKKGCVELVILAVLERADKYGYDLMQEISEKSGGAFCVTEGSLYPTLYRLEDKGYISSRKLKTGKRQTKVYYHLEETGREYLEELKKSYYAINAGVQSILEG